MKIFVSHSRNFDFENELYKPIRASALNSEHDFFLPHENQQSVNTHEVIKNSDLVLAEVSFPATGQGIELGWADAAKIPILCISKNGADISGSLKYITNDFLIYSSAQDLLSQLEAKVK